MSYDLPILWPTDFARAAGWFKVSDRPDRLRFLSRVGTRFVILPTPPAPDARPLATLAFVEQMHLYDFNPSARRAYVVPDALLGPDVNWQIEGMFQVRFDPARGVLVSGRRRRPWVRPARRSPRRRPSDDGLNRVVIRAGSPGDGYLADGHLQSRLASHGGRSAGAADARQRHLRAVHLSAGEHLVASTTGRGSSTRSGDHLAHRPHPRHLEAARPPSPRCGFGGAGSRDAECVRCARAPGPSPSSPPRACRFSAPSPTAVFFVRDLSFFFWSRHPGCATRSPGGEAPVDPHVAGQSAIADALNQLLMPITVAIHAAVGRRRFILSRCRRWPRRCSSCAAALAHRALLGACVCAVGRLLTLNTPNLSWSVALMPWVLLATDRVEARPSAPRLAALAGLRAAGAWWRAGHMGVDRNLAVVCIGLKAETTDSKKESL